MVRAWLGHALALAACSSSDDADLVPYEDEQPATFVLDTRIEPGATVTLDGERLPHEAAVRQFEVASQQALAEMRYEVAITRGDQSEIMFVGSFCAFEPNGPVVHETYVLYVGPSDLAQPLSLGTSGTCRHANGVRSSWIAD